MPAVPSIPFVRKTVLATTLMLLSVSSRAQNTFQSGWKTYKTGTLTKQYDYTFDFRDSVKLALLDSVSTFASTDSTVVVILESAPNAKPTRTVNYLNNNQKVVKSEYYIGETLMKVNQWRYDPLNRITYFSYSETSAPRHNYIRTYSYQVEKTAEGSLETERSTYNGRAEFTTEHYFNKKHEPLRDIRMNDVHHVEHIETFVYDKEGNLKERVIFFPEFRATKHFEVAHTDGKCEKNFPKGIDKVIPSYREVYLRHLIAKYKLALLDDNCPTLEYNFNNPGTDILITKEKEHHTRKISFITKYRLAPQDHPNVVVLPAKPVKDQKRAKK